MPEEEEDREDRGKPGNRAGNRGKMVREISLAGESQPRTGRKKISLGKRTGRTGRRTGKISKEKSAWGKPGEVSRQDRKGKELTLGKEKDNLGGGRISLEDRGKGNLEEGPERKPGKLTGQPKPGENSLAGGKDNLAAGPAGRK